MMVFENGKVHRAIACTETSILESKTTTYKPKDLENPKIPIVQYVSKIEFVEKDNNFEVKIYRYATEQTTDALMWQANNLKAQA